MRRLLTVLLVAAATIWMFQHPDELRRGSTVAFSKLAQYFESLAGRIKGGAVPEANAAQPPPPAPSHTYAVSTQQAKRSPAPVAGLRVNGTPDPTREMRDADVNRLATAASPLTAAVSEPATTGLPLGEGGLPRGALGAQPAETQGDLLEQLQEVDARLTELNEELDKIGKINPFTSRSRTQSQQAMNEIDLRAEVRTLEARKSQLLEKSRSPSDR